MDERSRTNTNGSGDQSGLYSSPIGIGRERTDPETILLQRATQQGTKFNAEQEK